MKRTGLKIAGVLLLLVGTVWFFQGIGVPRSLMMGRSFWATAGIVVVIEGVVALRFSRRKPIASQPMASLEIELESDEAWAKGQHPMELALRLAAQDPEDRSLLSGSPLRLVQSRFDPLDFLGR